MTNQEMQGRGGTGAEWLGKKDLFCFIQLDRFVHVSVICQRKAEGEAGSSDIGSCEGSTLSGLDGKCGGEEGSVTRWLGTAVCQPH